MTNHTTPDRAAERALLMNVAMLMANEFQELRHRDNRDLLAALPSKWAIRLAEIAIREVKATRS